MSRVGKEFRCGGFYRSMSLVVVIATGLDQTLWQSSRRLSRRGFDGSCCSDGERARFHAVVREGMPEFLNILCEEARSYDVVDESLVWKPGGVVSSDGILTHFSCRCGNPKEKKGYLHVRRYLGANRQSMPQSIQDLLRKAFLRCLFPPSSGSRSPVATRTENQCTRVRRVMC